jgi:hypothetical protein
MISYCDIANDALVLLLNYITTLTLNYSATLVLIFATL